MLPAATTLVAGLAACVAAAFVLASCGGQTVGSTVQAISLGDPVKPYLGMSKSEVISCAGAPHSRFGSGPDSETLTYRYNGAGPVPATAGAASAKKAKTADKGEKDGKDKKSSGLMGKLKDSGGDWTCSASLVFESDRLVRVSYSHKDVRSPFEWQGEDDPKKREELKNQPVPTCGFSLPRCRR